MKNFALLLAIILLSFSSMAQVAINTDGSDPDLSAMLDIKSENSGILIPRVLFANRPVDPANGLFIYQTDSIRGFYYYDGGEWIKINELQTVVEQGYEVSLSQGGGTFINGIISYTQAGIDTLVTYDGLTVHNATTNCINYYSMGNWFENCGICTPMPSQAMAGYDTAFYDETLSTTLAANTPEQGTGLWTVESGEGGSFDDASLPDAVFTGQHCTYYTLAWSISNYCDTNTDLVDVSFFATSTVAEAGDDQAFYDETLSTTLNANTPEVGTGLWTIYSGTGGSFADSTNPKTMFYGLPDNIYNLVWTISSECGSSSDSVVIIFAIHICGNQLITDDRDGNTYSTIQIGTQCWMAENLAYLPSVHPSSHGTPTYPRYYVYGYQGTDTSDAKGTYNYSTYGVLYNWPAAMDGDASSNSVLSGIQGICPAGWHLPGDEEWKILEGEVDNTYNYPNSVWDGTGWRGTDAGLNLREAGTTHWNSPNADATNSSGFTALPAGWRTPLFKTFNGMGLYTVFWSSTMSSTDNAWSRELAAFETNVYRMDFDKEFGYSVRCLRD